MKAAKKTVTGLLVSPAIVVGAVTGVSQAVHAAAPAKHVAYTQADHRAGPGWDHYHHGGPGWDHDHHGGPGQGWNHRDPRWDPRQGDRYDPRWGYYRYDPNHGYWRYDPSAGHYRWWRH